MNAQNQSNFFNFTADAVAYINEVKLIDINGHQCVAIKGCIIEGKDGKSKSPVDMLVRGQQAADVIYALEEWWPQGYGSDSPRWFAGIRIGSIKAKPYVSKGEAKAVLSARILAVKWLKIDDQDIEVPEWKTIRDDDAEGGDEDVGQQSHAAKYAQAKFAVKPQVASKPAQVGNKVQTKAASKPKLQAKGKPAIKPVPKKVA